MVLAVFPLPRSLKKPFLQPRATLLRCRHSANLSRPLTVLTELRFIAIYTIRLPGSFIEATFNHAIQEHRSCGFCCLCFRVSCP